MTATFDRRNFLKQGAAVTAGGLLVNGGTQALGARVAAAAPAGDGEKRLVAPDNGGYGPISPVADRATGEPMLNLPEGFEYTSFGYSAAFAATLGRPTEGDDGYPTPDRHDGMAAFATDTDGVVRLVRNHERGYEPVPVGGTDGEPLVGDSDTAYDVTSGGGTTTLTFDTREKRLTESYISINGTSVNCAGGLTPAGSWLTCEETTNGRHNGFSMDHGYIFEVPAFDGVVDNPTPLKAMGRFVHEAIAVDPTNGIIYETEDNGNTSGFYRFIPRDPEDLGRGGVLQMLAVKGQPQFETYHGVSDRIGEAMTIEWVTIDNPDPDITSEARVFTQGWEQGAAAFARLEGCWSDGGSIFFNATSGGDEGLGQVWEYRPRGRYTGQLILLFESPSVDLLDAPDNITVSPRGGLVLCEDGGGEQYLRGLDEEGQIFDLARNSLEGYEGMEFAGATYSPDGEVLFVNIQTPGVSFAIWGPWNKGSV